MKLCNPDKERFMRRQLVAGIVLGAALLVPSMAGAKGPESASLTGPGLEERALVVVGVGEMGRGTPLGTLVDSGGFFAQMYGQVPDPTLKFRPRGTLGAHYRVTYVVPGPNAIKSRVVQDVYPFAKPVPLTYMKPGQRFWGTRTAHGGWFRSSVALRQALVQAGLHAR
jgi:hypothetical protein